MLIKWCCSVDCMTGPSSAVDFLLNLYMTLLNRFLPQLGLYLTPNKNMQEERTNLECHGTPGGEEPLLDDVVVALSCLAEVVGNEGCYVSPLAKGAILAALPRLGGVARLGPVPGSSHNRGLFFANGQCP